MPDNLPGFLPTWKVSSGENLEGFIRSFERRKKGRFHPGGNPKGRNLKPSRLEVRKPGRFIRKRTKTKNYIMKYEALTAGFTYHIYNRGNNSDIVFPEACNYDYFLFLMKRHLLPIAEIYAYCLMNNHFHFVLRIKDEVDLPVKFKKRPFQAFSNMFNAYTRAINNFTGRTGSLFEKNFERKLISEDVYFRNLISYVHCNPVHHRVCSNFREYPYSSIYEYTSDKKLLISESIPLQLFDGLENFIAFHEIFQKREMYVEMEQELK